MPQVTVFLTHNTYLPIALEARDNRTTCSAILRGLAEKKFGGSVNHGRKKGK